MTILLLGTSFSTGNLGVSALAWSCIMLVRKKWPDADILLVGNTREKHTDVVRINTSKLIISTLPVRYCPNIFVDNHIIGLFIVTLLCRFFPFLKNKLSSGKSTSSRFNQGDLILDITGGDSFSDIYGFGRFFRSYLLKRVGQLSGKPFIMMPQTYGPFNSTPAKIIARRILDRCTIIYSRDKESLSLVENMIGKRNNIRLCPDVAFIMEPISKKNETTARIKKIKEENKKIVGINISGLLYNGGYTKNNMFHLACNYRELMKKIIAHYASKIDHMVIIIPHVLPPSGYSIEDDYLASADLLKNELTSLQENILLLDKGYDQNETKYYIGLCDFFIGARMHATIAALSQNVPAVGMAYSKKFTGVFETAGVKDCVLDMRKMTQDEIIDNITVIYDNLEETTARLKEKMVDVQKAVLEIFNDVIN